MAQDWIGVVVGFNTGDIKAVVNPTDDSELDNPQWLLIQGGDPEPMTMVLVPRSEYVLTTSLAELTELVAKYQGATVTPQQ